MRRRNQYELNMTEGSILKNVLLFAFPFMLSNILQLLYNAADLVVVGRFAGHDAMAAVGATGALINLLVNVFLGFSLGVSVVVSRKYGAKDAEGISRAVHTSVVLAVISGVLAMIVGFIFSKRLLILMDTPEGPVLDGATLYMKIIFAGVPAMIFYNFGAAILRAVGDTKRPLYILAMTGIVNVVLNLILVLGFGMSVEGVAIATATSNYLSALAVLYILIASDSVYKIYPKELKIYKKELLEVIRIGLPAGVQPIMYSFTNILLQAAVNGFGTDIAAAYTAYSKLDVYYWMFANALSISVTTFVGQNFGAQQYGRLKKGRWLCMGMSFAAASLLSLIFIGAGRPLLALFTADAEVLDYGMQIIALMVPLYALYGLNEVTVGMMRGVGDSLVPTLITFVGVCITRIVWILWVVPAHHTLETLLRCFPISWMLTAAFLGLYDLFGGWLKRAVRRAGTEDSCI